MSATAGTATDAGVALKSKVAQRGKTRRRWEAADSVIAASAALVAIIVGTFVLLCVQGYGNTIENSKARTQTAASVVAEGTRWVVSSARAMLDTVAISISGDAALADAQIVTRFEAAASVIPAGLELGVYDAAGNAIANASSVQAPRTIAEKDYFRLVAGGSEWAVGAQEKNPETGAATFAIVRRLATDGAFTGAALIIVDARVLERLAGPQDMGKGSTISIVRSDGWVIARTPSLAAPFDLGETEAFHRLTAADSGSYESAASPADGVARIVSFRHVDDLGYIAIASVSRDTALAGLWSAIWIVSLLIAPIALALLVGSVITARLLRRSQSTSRSLAAALAHNETLFREIHHRVKNNLQSVNSLLQLQPIPREVRLDMSQRIAAMSAVHEHIYRSRTFSEVLVKDYLHTLIGSIRAGYGPHVEVFEEIEDVAVDKDAATPLGLIVNEVVSNSFKHAFRDGRRGTVSVSLRALGDGRAQLTVRDNGVGFDPEAPTKGIGRRLIGGFTAQLQGESSHTSDADGSEFTLVFPLARG